MNEYKRQLDASRDEWDKEAPQFDNEPDHGLHNPATRKSWKTLLQETIIPTTNKVLDIGCGTGSLSLLLAELGYQVTGADLSPNMLAIAQEKSQQAGYDIPYHVMDAAHPEFEVQSFDVIVCRHLLWTLTDPQNVLKRWQKLLKSTGQFVLIEGFWHTGGGLHADDIIQIMPSNMAVSFKNLSDNAHYWGEDVHDERYLISAILH